MFEGLTGDDVFNTSKTIAEAFVFIKDLINQNVASLEVENHDAHGFPALISMDYNIDFIDDEILYRNTNFETENERVLFVFQFFAFLKSTINSFIR